MYVVSAIIVLFIFLTYFLGFKLYSEPENEGYFNNVNELNFEKTKYIAPNPKYITSISILVGIFIGTYLALCSKFVISSIVSTIIVLIVFWCYLVEITRRIIIQDNKIILSKLFSKKIELNGLSINGMYIYSFTKKFLKKHALTTKLVITTNNNKKYKFVLSGIDNKAVLNMMKENFGIVDYKMYIGKKVQYEI